MKAVAFYHIYCTENNANWANIFLDQFTTLENSGLLDQLENVFITMIATREAAVRLADLAALFNKDQKIAAVRWDNPYYSDQEMVDNIDRAVVTEAITHAGLWQWCHGLQEPYKVLYFHSKGITAYRRHLDNAQDWDGINAQVYGNYFFWRRFLDWGCMTNWMSCVGKLNHVDLCGVNYMSTPAPHFSGGYFWANSDYIKKLPNPQSIAWWDELQAKTQDQWLKQAPKRFKDEMWVASIPHAVWNIKGESEGTNLSRKTLKPRDYNGES